MHLHRNGFLLRPLVTTDAPALAAAIRASMPALGEWMSWARADYDEAGARDFIATCTAARSAASAYEFGIFRVADGGFVGVAGLNQFNRANNFCNLGYWVRTTAQRQGAGLAAVQSLASYAFEQLDLTRVEIVVAEDNLPSLALARKAGATLECTARNRLMLHGRPVAAHVLSLLPIVPQPRTADR